MMSFSRGAVGRHHCPMEVDNAYGLASLLQLCLTLAVLSEIINISFAQIEQYAHLHRYS